jgi:hypothetical protein
MKNHSLKTYKEKPRHLNKRATEAMSFRAVPEIKNAVKDIAIKFECSMTVVILKALRNYCELLEACGGVKSASVHGSEDVESFAEITGR